MIGYNKNLVVGIWCGYDDNRLINSGDGTFIKYIWAEIMEKYTNDLVEKACKNTKVNIPDCMIEDYVKDMKANSEKQAAQYNIPFEMYLQYMGYTLESFEKQAKEVANKRIKADLVLSKIAEKEEVKVTPEELQAELTKLAEANSMELAEVQKRVNLNQLAINLEQSKVIDILKANAVAPAKKTKKAE